MNLLDEVKEKLASTGKNSIRKIDSLSDTAQGYIIRDDYWYGVAIPYEGRRIEEDFANARLCSQKVPFNGQMRLMLVLECSIEEVRNQFASLCTEFLDPGKDNRNRHALIADPYRWWNKWRELLGNAIHEKRPYQILGELLSLEYLLKSGEQAVWQGAKGNTQDISTDTCAYEVKSTLDRYTTQVTISSKFQLDPHGKPLKLIFVRFEPSANGDSLEKAIIRLQQLGCDKGLLLWLLARQGVVPGNQAYTTTYNLLEMRMYDVDETFPVITDSDFSEGHIPQHVVRFTYTIDLAGIPYKAVN